MACRCQKCGRIVDCNGDDLCELCECLLEIEDIHQKSHDESIQMELFPQQVLTNTQ